MLRKNNNQVRPNPSHPNGKGRHQEVETRKVSSFESDKEVLPWTKSNEVRMAIPSNSSRNIGGETTNTFDANVEHWNTMMRKFRWMAICIFVVGSLAIVGGAYMVTSLDTMGNERLFQEYFRTLNARLEQTLAGYVLGLELMVEVVKEMGYDYQPHDTTRFSSAAKKLLKGRSFQAIQYVSRVNHSERAFIEARSTDYWNEYFQTNETFSFKEMGGDGMIPRADADFYFPVLYVEPVETNEHAINFDIHSASTIKAAMEKILETGEFAVTERLQLIQETSYSVLLLFPSSSFQFLLGVVRVPAILETMRGDLVEGLSVILCDNTENDKSMYLGGLGSAESQFVGMESIQDVMDEWENQGDHLFAETTHAFAGRTWSFHLVANNAFTSLSLERIIVIAALAVTTLGLLVALLFHAVVRRMNSTKLAYVNEQKLRVAKAESRAHAESFLNEFVAHEVRNPLSVAMIASDFIEVNATVDCESSETIKADARLIKASLSHINELLTNVLDLNKLVEGKIRLRPAPCSIRESVLMPVKDMLQRNEKNISFMVECNEDFWVKIDALRLKQIVINLVKNSIKFVSRGFIRVIARYERDSMVILIEDSGPGIPPKHRDQLFTKYELDLNLMKQGSGIGLCLTKILVDAMGGHIGIDDRYKSGVPGFPGVRFVIVIPTPKIDKQEPIKVDKKHSSMSQSYRRGNYNPTIQIHPSTEEKGENESNDFTINLLIVDDDAVIRKIMQRCFKGIYDHLVVTEAASGQEAVDICAKNPNFDVIIIDHYMPVIGVENALTGEDTIRKLREMGVPSVLIGSSANEMEKEHVAAGADAFLRKPLPSKEALVKALFEALQLPRNLSFLIVDDEKVNLALLARALAQTAPYASIKELQDPTQALAVVEENSQQFDIIILDEHYTDEEMTLGSTLAKRFRKQAPKAVIISLSGSPLDINAHPEFDICWSKPLVQITKLKYDLRVALSKRGNVSASKQLKALENAHK